MKYREGYKYQLAEEYSIDFESINVDTNFIKCDGKRLIIKQGYAWDGATWYPDKPGIMRGSLVHDAIYQLIRRGKLPRLTRIIADKLLEQCCLEDGMNKIEAKMVYYAVKLFGKKYTLRSSIREVKKSPY